MPTEAALQQRFLDFPVDSETTACMLTPVASKCGSKETCERRRPPTGQFTPNRVFWSQPVGGSLFLGDHLTMDRTRALGLDVSGVHENERCQASLDPTRTRTCAGRSNQVPSGAPMIPARNGPDRQVSPHFAYPSGQAAPDSESVDPRSSEEIITMSDLVFPCAYCSRCGRREPVRIFSAIHCVCAECEEDIAPPEVADDVDLYIDRMYGGAYEDVD